MRLFQPKPNYSSGRTSPPGARVECPYRVSFLRYRYGHHAAPSGYDRICDYVDAPTVELSNLVYFLGETLLRPYCLYHSRFGGKFEYSRYDCVQEIQLLKDALFAERERLYHFVYAEKSFHLTETYLNALGRRGHKFVATVHHMPEQQASLFRTHNHFRSFDAIFTMDKRSIPFWEGVTQRKNVHWVPHGVDTSYFVPSQSRTSSRRVLFAGTHERDLETLKRTIEVLSSHPEIEFDLIGPSQQLKSIGDEFSNVLVHHRVSDETYLRLIQEASVLLLPLRSSTFCNVVLECLACGVPVVTTEGGIEAYLNSDCSQLSPPGDAPSLASNVLWMFDHLDEASAAARRCAMIYSWQQVARLHVELYGQIAKQKIVSQFSTREARHSQ